MNEKELKMKIFDWKKSWHVQYQDSSYIYIDQKTGKSKGFCFIGYENQLSTILSVDNFNGIKIMYRIIELRIMKLWRAKNVHKTIQKAQITFKNDPSVERDLTHMNETKI
ncbi:hypothetical protein HZS_4896 [Henneguya salminicola]|nr:hypothetical protein HZS_4896 [Henneguya salminicola]